MAGGTKDIQNKAKLVILPFTGGKGQDGEIIASLMENQSGFDNDFEVIDRTSNVEAIMKEQQFQRSSGLTDADTIAKLGKQANADFVIAGHIVQFQNKKLVLFTVIHVESLQQIAGDYREYQNIAEIRSKLPGVTRNIVNVSKKSSAKLPALAVLPFDIPENVTANDAEVLAQILAIHIANAGVFAVLPRTQTIQTVMKEQNIQRSGLTDKDSIKAIGKATNARYVLAGKASRLGEDMNLFDVKILDVEKARRLKGTDMEYENISDGLRIMEELALTLTGKDKAAAKARRERKREDFKYKANDFFEEEYPYSYWSMGLSLGTTFATPRLTLSPNITIPIVKVAYLDTGCDFGFFPNADYIKDLCYNSYYPYIRASAFLPFGDERDELGSKFGFHIGFGYGCMIADYRFGDYDNRAVVNAFDAAVGLLFINAIDISYSVRTNFKGVNNKLSLGYVYRFPRENQKERKKS
ncbi:MAG: penicillin-binding protein activator LpoB [Treponema sp.]|nr:penicillin-binding protein activator LpoB [Treponema sp.]